VAYPSAKMLDTWLGQDGVHYIREQYLKAIIENHMNAAESDLTHREGAGALNFLSLEDLAVGEEGEAGGRRQEAVSESGRTMTSRVASRF
jgi:metal transporter CNNM